MDGLEFIGVIATAAVVIVWYWRNADAGADGLRGLLALADDPESARPNARRRAYRIKSRIARRAHERRDADDARAGAKAALTFKPLGEAARMRRKFRRQDEARYRVMDKAAAHKPTAEKR